MVCIFSLCTLAIYIITTSPLLNRDADRATARDTIVRDTTAKDTIARDTIAKDTTAKNTTVRDTSKAKARDIQVGIQVDI